MLQAFWALEPLASRPQFLGLKFSSPAAQAWGTVNDSLRRAVRIATTLAKEPKENNLALLVKVLVLVNGDALRGANLILANRKSPSRGTAGMDCFANSLEVGSFAIFTGALGLSFS